MSTPSSYFSRTPKIKNERQMFEKLAERTAKIAPMSGDADSSVCVPPAAPPAAAPTRLRWLPPIKGTEAILTDCGRFSVSRAKVMGVYRYTAWSRRPTPTPIGVATDTSDQAKALCEAACAG